MNFLKRVRSILISVIRVAIAVSAVIVLLMLFTQESLIFHPTKLAADFDYRFPGDFEQRWLEYDGEKLDTILFRAPQAKGTLLYFHGNAGALDSWGFAAVEIAQKTRWNVWVIDYPGFGRSGGNIRSEKQLHEMAAAFYQMARRELGPSERIGAYGRSIGSGFAVKLAADYPLAILVLETPYLSLKSLAKAIFPLAPSFLLRYTIHSDAWLPSIDAPVLIVHGERDEVIPFTQGKALAELARNGTFVSIPTGRHNDLSESREYWDALAKFLN